MTQHLRVPALLCLVVLASTVSGQHGGLFGAPKKSNFEALLDKLPKGFRDLLPNGGGAEHKPAHLVETPAGAYVAAVADSVGEGFSRVLHAAQVQAHRGVIVPRLVAYCRQVVAWVRLRWATLVAKLPGHHQTRLEAATTQLQAAWDAFQKLAGQAVEYVVNLAAAVWQTVPVSGKTGSGDLRSIATSTKDTAVQAAHTAAAQTAHAAREFWATIGPGGRWHPQAFFDLQGHLVVEALLVVVISALLFQRSYKPVSRKGDDLTDKEIEDLCEEWQPEPLGRPLTAAQEAYEPVVISSPVGRRVVANGAEVLNLASFNFIGASGDPKIKEMCEKTINKYGVGSCGPRGFYGTIDVHLQLEERLAQYMGTQESIIYSYDLATVPSILPAFANSRDLIIVDEDANYAIQNGCTLTRARVLRFKHNDVADLERVLAGVAKEDLTSKRPLNRRYIVVEGIYANTGLLAPLDKMVPLKHKYKYRLVVDESLALGVLGTTGRGACEHFGLTRDDVEIVSASLGNSLASVGGFCAGDREIVDHQRLSGLGYCFSASLPPYLATAAIGALDMLEEKKDALLPAVTGNARVLRGLLADVSGEMLAGSQARSELGLTLVGGMEDAVSPVLHLRLTKPATDAEAAEATLQAIVDDVLSNGVLACVHRLSSLDRLHSKIPPSLRLVVTAEHTPEDLQTAADAVVAAAKRVLKL